jgi:hypothetical protein
MTPPGVTALPAFRRDHHCCDCFDLAQLRCTTRACCSTRFAQRPQFLKFNELVTRDEAIARPNLRNFKPKPASPTRQPFREMSMMVCD